MAGRRRTTEDKLVPIEDYEHLAAKRTNNPPAGLAHLDRDETPTRTIKYEYDPHLDPVLNWAGKAERAAVDVPAPSIHVHEELSSQKIIGSVRRQRLQQPLFDIDVLDPADAVEFYEHDLNWSNRMVLGDSLMVMASLLDRERLAGQVQCVFMDPPYGIKYGSNFQPNIGNRTVKDGADASLTREPEMIQAYRDTWGLSTHSYLTYLRDRFTTARELLNDSGSIFVQIGEENVHRVRVLLDEVFGADNFVSQITFKTTGGAGAPNELRQIAATTNYLHWYAKSKAAMKYRPLFTPRDPRDLVDDFNYKWIEESSGARRAMTKDERTFKEPLPEGARIYNLDNLTSQTGGETTTFPVTLGGDEYRPAKGGWKTNRQGMDRLLEADRVELIGKTPRYVRFLDDFDAQPLINAWFDTATSGFSSEKRYVVQTNPRVISRCVLMTTDPGDLVVDPTCGSGTTALVSEQYGRRWITVDTSRVALAIARERLLTSKFDYYELADPERGIDGGLKYKVINRVTLRSIARGEEPERVPLYDQPAVERGKVRVTGPFTTEALSRYATNPRVPDVPSLGVSRKLVRHVS
jgi:adenine-specific DNA-methyltransferase